MVKWLNQVITLLSKKIVFKDLTIIVIFLSLLGGFFKRIIFILIIVLLHEFGHVLVCFLFHYKIDRVEIFPFGGITKIDKHLNNSIYKDIILALGGITIQLIILFLGKIHIINNELFLEYNYIIMLFNMLPIIPLDGSKIVFELLNIIMSYNKSLISYIWISILSIIIFIYYNLTCLVDKYIIIGLFIQKTLEIILNRQLIINKFILERKIYHLKFRKSKCKNEDPLRYKKDIKYYYYLGNKLVDEREYLCNYLGKIDLDKYQ